MGTIGNQMIEAARDLWFWVSKRPMVVDVLVATLAAILGLAELTGDDIIVARDPDLLGVLLVLGGASALVLRRTMPIPVLVVVVSLMTIAYIRDYGSLLSAVGLPALYSVAAHGEDRRRAWAAILIATGVLFAVASFTLMDNGDGYSIPNALSMLGFIGLAVAAGGIVRNRHEIFLSTKARADHAEATRQAEAERAVATERLRIAREMHDVVAHSMSVMAVQASAAQEIVHSEPERAITVMHSVESTGREALNEMRRMLGVLRNGDDAAAELDPQPTLADVDTLVAQSDASGIATRLDVSGHRRTLPPGIELAAYRIVQESLTNVRKHAGTRATAVVQIGYGPTALSIGVVDDGSATVPSFGDAGEGNGLIGIRERVEIYGGEFAAGPRTGGGYAVNVELPLTSAERSPAATSDGDRSGETP
ncbi:MAG: sensor histidine kinase [Acidimicrobiales bacterium]